MEVSSCTQSAKLPTDTLSSVNQSLAQASLPEPASGLNSPVPSPPSISEAFELLTLGTPSMVKVKVFVSVSPSASLIV